MPVDFLTAQNLAVLLLSFFAGLAVSTIFTARGAKGCVTFAFGLGVTGFIILALLQGRSHWIERLTRNLAEYIYFDALGVLGFLAGIALGVAVRRRG